ncbi:alpha/beta hydrolase [Gimesia aquarii]|uniref:Enterochelin esterase n=1 Tax=Gimesia aquarii TaxID=2527964 RepID=A0A517VYZ4_9PLAN|nr:alpha/beta hydrolase-fold protein [Gimesia aquarii]QDT98234.1 Enterochelin esterase [Gimesia aquarii]
MMNLEEHTLTSSCSEYTRRVWYLPAEQSPEKICLFLDGEYYVNQMDVPDKLTVLQREGLIPPVACLFVSYVDGETRHYDFTCNDRYARFITEDLIEWIQSRNAGISRQDCLIGGLSLSGLQAAYIALTTPEVFLFTLCQSGSLWWNNEWLKNDLQSRSTTSGKFWISVGDQETDSGIIHPPTGLVQDVDQISAVKRFADTLKAQGDVVHYHLFAGGHDPKCWEAEFSDAMQWLLG